MTDTSAEAGRVLIDVYRRMSGAKKWAILQDSYQTARVLHAAGVRLRNPTASDQDAHEAWLAQTVPFRVPKPERVARMTEPIENMRIIREVIEIFDKLGIAYALGGSLASSVHGIPRYTQDADITVESFPGKETALLESLGPDYYLSANAMREAIERRSSFNIIHTVQGFKLDIFVRGDHPFERSAMDRRSAVSLPDAPERTIFLHTPEDTVLFKLKWFRMGNETSEQQWKDILGVLQVQAGRLDEKYLNHWGAELGVADLLARAGHEAISR